MRRADRLFQIVQYLRGGRLTTAAMLAERLEVSERTIYRDIADLQGSGVPIDGEAGMGYLMRDGYDVPPLMFTSDEIVALVAGARMIRAWGGTAMAQSAEEALVKIQAVVPETTRARAKAVNIHAMAAHDMDTALRDRIDLLEGAADQRSRVRFAYADQFGAATTRTVRPLALSFWGRVWTLVAWCELRHDFRMFRLDRMGAIQTGDQFKPEKDKTLGYFFAQEKHLRPTGCE